MNTDTERKAMETSFSYLDKSNDLLTRIEEHAVGIRDAEQACGLVPANETRKSIDALHTQANELKNELRDLRALVVVHLFRQHAESAPEDCT